MSRNTRTATFVSLIATLALIAGIAIATETTGSEQPTPITPILLENSVSTPALEPETGVETTPAIEPTAKTLPSMEMILATVIDDCQLQCHQAWRVCRQNAQSAQSHDDCVTALEQCLADECGIGC